MIIHMSMTKRLQIPVTPSENDVFRAAARRQGLTLAEWARRHLRLQAEADLGSELTPQQALERLFALEAPVDDVETMIEQSVRGRLQ
jgi:hypothetical protein